MEIPGVGFYPVPPDLYSPGDRVLTKLFNIAVISKSLLSSPTADILVHCLSPVPPLSISILHLLSQSLPTILFFTSCPNLFPLYYPSRLMPSSCKDFIDHTYAILAPSFTPLPWYLEGDTHIAVAIWLQVSLNAEEGLYWYHLMSAVRKPRNSKSWLNSSFFVAWIVISVVTLVIPNTVIWINVFSEVERASKMYTVLGSLELT
jgi:hypothetical protein